MSDHDHHYQGRQAALQVFNEFSGSEGQELLDEEDEEVEEEEEEKVPEIEKNDTPQRPQRVAKLTEESAPSRLKRGSSWKRFKATVKETLTGWKGIGQDTEETSKLIEDKAGSKTIDIPIHIEAPQRSKSVRITRSRDQAATDKQKLRSSLKETKESPGLVPRIVVTKEDGRLATPSPKPLRKKDSFCASLPDVSNAGLIEEQASKSDNETSTSALSNKQVRQAIIDAARNKSRQKAVRFEAENSKISESTNQETEESSSSTASTITETTTSTITTTSFQSSSVRKTAFVKRETQSLSNPDVSQDAEKESAKLAVMKIRAAIANMTISTDGPILTTETILARRRLSSEETRTETLKTTAEQVSQRSSSVDFTTCPAQRKDLMAAAANSAGNSEKPQRSDSFNRIGSIKRTDSLKRTESMKRSESMKRKKARPMIWDHFDDVPHTSLQGRCKVCHMTVSCKFNTGHFVRHLQLAHRDVYLAYTNKMQSNWTRSQLERSLK